MCPITTMLFSSKDQRFSRFHFAARRMGKSLHGVISNIDFECSRQSKLAAKRLAQMRRITNSRQPPSSPRHFECLPDGNQHGKSEILLANAYFLPGMLWSRFAGSGRTWCKNYRFTPRQDRSPNVRFATQALYLKTLGIGILVFEYEKSFMHAKVAVIDRRWATVGSHRTSTRLACYSPKKRIYSCRMLTLPINLHDSLQAAIDQGARELSLYEIRTLLGIHGYYAG